MKIAIHHNNWPSSFSNYWIEYCQVKNISFKIVDCFKNDIISQLGDCDALMWHHSHDTFEDVLAAKKILFAIEHSGKKVFPNFKTGWHFDDKVAQMYLLKAVNAPIVPSYVFYEKQEALDWIDSNSFPKVFKLKGGSGSKNVQLVETRRNAKALAKRAFSNGFSQFNRINHFNYYMLKFKKSKKALLLVKAFAGLFLKSRFARLQHNEKGYIYFQDFIENDGYDIRIIIVHNRAFAIKRLVRKDDFRASGSGNLIYDVNQIDLNCIRVAFDVNRSIESQCIAFDFVKDKQNNPYIVEISYGYAADLYKPCEGYWTQDLQFYPGHFDPQAWMVDHIVKEIAEST
jgi:glutathione synthase/RimK-type ligase-like ATP-grasp enzyme